MTKVKRSGAPKGERNGKANKDLTDAIRREIRRDHKTSARAWAAKFGVYESTIYRIKRAK